MDSGEERDLGVRSNYLPSLPLCLLQGTSVRVEYGEATSAANPSDAQMICEMFPHTFGQPLVRFLSDTADLPSTSLSSNNSITPIRVGVVFCGRQSPGGHNVLWGIHNALKTHNPDSVLLGFVDGYEGLSAPKTLEITDDILSTYKNQGGCDLLFKKEDQITTAELVNAAMTSCTSLKLDGLVIIGGVTSNNYAAQLAETFTEAKCPTKVVGVPVTVNGDLKNQFVETNVGFDTVCKVTSQLISNACTDALSAGKYYYFLRLMGGKASHFALECTLQSHPNMVILGEEVSASKFTLSDLIKQICDSVQARADQDKYHGVILLPEGLTGSIPEVYALLKEIHALLEKGVSVDEIPSQLSPSISALFESLPSSARDKLFLLPELDDPAQLSQIETEKILAQLVEIEMNKRLKEGTYEGKKFNAICNCFGYETRGSSPSKFDCDYAFVVGHVCYHILVAGLTGYLASVTKLKNPVNEWHCGAAPITAMMTVESHGKPALHPATVDLKGKAYEMLRQNATKFLMEDVYRNLGPIQFDGPGADSKSTTLCIEGEDCVGITQDEEVAVDRVTSETSPPSHDVTQSFDEEKAIVSEFSTHLESREEDMVAEAVEYVIVDGKDTFPSSKPEKEEASAIKDPNNCQIQDTDYMKPESNGVDLLCPVDNAVETKEEEEASLTKYPSDVPNEDEAVQKNSCETENSLNSTGDFMESEASRGDEEELLVTKSSRDSHSPEPKEDDLLCPLENAAESISEQEASVSKDIVCPVINVAEGEKTILPIKPCDCRIEDEVVQKDLSQTDNNIPEANEEEEASVTGLPCDCPIPDAVVHKESSEVEVVQKNLSQNDNNIPEAKEEDEALVAGLPCDCPVPDAAVHKESSEDDVVQKDWSQNDNNIPEAKEEEETLVMGLPCDCPIPDAAVHKESSESDNYVNSPIDLMTPEIVGDELLGVVDNIAEPEKEALVTEDSSDCHIQDAALLHDSSETANRCNSIGGLRTLEPDVNELLCPVKNILEAEEEEEVSVVENPSDCQDANLRQDSYESGNNLHSSEDSIKSETKGGNIMSPVNNGANVQVKVTKASDEVDEISNGAEEDAEVRKASNEVDELSNGTEVEVEKPSDEVDEISTGTEVEVEVAKPSNKVDEISDGVKVEVVKTSEEVNEIPNSTEGEVDVAKASDKANEISNGTEAMSCHVKGGLVHEITSSVDNIVSDSEIHNSSLNGMKVSYTNAPVISRASVQFGSFVPGIYQASVVSENDVSKPPPAAEESTAHPKVEKDVDVEVEFVVERPFNFLIRMPKYYDDELNEQIRQAEVQVTEKTQKREAIKFQMQVIRGNLQQARSDYTAKVSEERDVRRLVRLKRQEIDHVQSIINRVKNAISVEDIDTRIKHMEHMMQHETLPLKEEKQFIREIKQLKLYREQLSSNMGSQDEVRKAMDEREQIEEQLKTLKKDLERLKQKVSNAEAIAVEADTKLKEEKKKLEKIYTQHGEAQNIRQEAYMNLQNLRKQFYEKNAHFRTFKDDTTAAHNYASSRDKGALHRLCLNQVEKMMELWNKDDEFRKEYVRCNTRSTLWRLRTMDGRALGPNEEQVLVGVTSFVDKSNTSSCYRVGQVNPELPLVTPEVDKREKPLSTIKAAEIPEFKSVEKVVEQTNKKEKAKKPAIENNSLPVNDSVEKKRKIVDTMEEVSNNKKQTKEEQEVNRKEEQSRNKEEEAKLKEQRRLEETAKAKEALERKRKIAEKAQIRAEARAQKEAEQKDKEKEKRAKKKERKKAGVGGEEGEIIAPASDLTAVMTVKETDTKELNPTPVVAVTAAKKPPKAFTKQHNKIKTASALPAPLRNKNKRKWQQWIWFVVGGLAVIAVVFLANMGLYPNQLGRNRYPGY